MAYIMTCTAFKLHTQAPCAAQNAVDGNHLALVRVCRIFACATQDWPLPIRTNSHCSAVHLTPSLCFVHAMQIVANDSDVPISVDDAAIGRSQLLIELQHQSGSAKPVHVPASGATVAAWQHGGSPASLELDRLLAVIEVR